jgi:endonuclease/exonuclease/phosphatase family metal-dependent hydrolase
VDIALLQEVTPGANITFSGYQSHVNIGTSERGTAILAKAELPLHRIERITSSRGIVAYYGNICILNISAPSGSSDRKETVEFFNTGLMALLPHVSTEMILAGDFDCVLSNSECTGHRPSSRALDKLVQGLRLYDAWDQASNIQTYTHFTPSGAARLDRLYVTEGLRRNKQGVETIADAFTDHLAVLRVNLAEVVEGGA